MNMGDDLKIIFYIVVAIVWVVFNNYRKIAGESRKRDPSKAPDEVIRENWPTLSGEKQERSGEPPPPVFTETVTRRVQPVTLDSRSKPLKKSAQRQREDSLSLVSMLNPDAEGGNIRPSGMVQFEEPSMVESDQIALLDRIRHTDLQSAFLWSEILKNPYNQSFETIKYG